MRLPPGELMFGVAPPILRDCARQLRDHPAFSRRDFCKALGAPWSEAKPVLRDLVREGFVIVQHAKSATYAPTSKFSQLAAARVTRGLKRAKATDLLKQVVQRANEINARPGEFHVRILQMAVFGSYIGQAEVLGDLDVAVRIEYVHPLPPMEYELARRDPLRCDVSVANARVVQERTYASASTSNTPSAYLSLVSFFCDDSPRLSGRRRTIRGLSASCCV